MNPSPVQTKTWVTNPDNIPLKMSRNSSTTITVHSVNSFEKSLSLLSVSSNEISPGQSVDCPLRETGGHWVVGPRHTKVVKMVLAWHSDFCGRVRTDQPSAGILTGCGIMA